MATIHAPYGVWHGHAEWNNIIAAASLMVCLGGGVLVARRIGLHGERTPER